MMDRSLTNHEKSTQTVTNVSREFKTFHNFYMQTADGPRILYVQYRIQSTRLSVGV